MKRIFFLTGIYLLVNCFVFAQTNVPGGEVNGTWTKTNSPYLIQGAIMIANDSTLTIEPGVSVIFQGGYKFMILGRLLAVGTVSDSITFTAANTATGWLGIQFDNTPATNNTSKFYYCKLTYGKASGGGAFYFSNYSKAIISNSRVFNNLSSNNGGGIYCDSSSPTISNNTISNNYAYNNGCGIYCNFSNPTISNNTISNNSANRGGGIYCYFSNPTISNNIISNNSANEGGGIYCYESSPTISNNTFSNNTSPNGGALFCFKSDPILYNTILWGNTATITGNQVYLYDESSDPNFYFCDVQGGKAGFGLNTNIFYLGTYSNNIDADPLFVSPSAGSGTTYNGVVADWSIQSGSPCINKGDSSGTYPPTDKAGNPRICDGRIDIGAYEFQQGSCITGIIAIENSENKISIFPNPANSMFYLDIENTDNEKIELTIINVLGQEMLKINYNGITKGRFIKEIDMNGLADQIYFVRININEEVFLRKMSKIK